jgi:alkylation response protein AidB-like acyl-CoA dehydrogenase
MNSAAIALISALDRRLTECRQLLNRPEGFTRDLIDELHELGAFRIFIPRDNGGIYQRYSDCLTLVSTAAHHSLELALMLGITSSLFVLPVGRYANPEVRERVLTDFSKRRLLAGMMMTEPDYGTNIMGILTSFRPEASGYRLRGLKHWAGLTGVGEYWLVSARKEREQGVLGRDIDFFIVRSDQPGYSCEQLYPAAGLNSITYGLTRFDVAVPAEYKLCGPQTNIRVLYDILNRSRISISAIAAGATRRLLEDAARWCGERLVFGKPLAAYEQVQYRLASMQAAWTICAAASSFAGTLLNAHEDPEPFIEMLTANIVKVTTSDLLQMSAQSGVQLLGGQGFRKDHYTGKAFVDSRPFQIFEGSNDVLYEAIAAQLIGEARKLGLRTLGEALARHPGLPSPTLPDDPVRNLPLPSTDSQVDRVLFGKIFARYASIGIVQNVASTTSDPLIPGAGALTDSAVAFLQAECETYQNERTTRHRCRYIS